MSATLMWEPANRKANSLPDALKFILRDRWESSGVHGRITFSRDNIEYLSGLRDAQIDGARELIDAIEKYDEVELWLEY